MHASVRILYQEALKEAVFCYNVAFIKSTKAVCITNEHNFIAIFHHPHKYVDYFLTLSYCSLIFHTTCDSLFFALILTRLSMTSVTECNDACPDI